MYIVEGTYNKKKLQSKRYVILSKDDDTKELELFYSNKTRIRLKNNLISVDIVADERATGGGVQGAAGGAVLGFLILGPLGTAIGAGLGSKKKGRDNTTLAITWANGDVWVVDSVTTEELAALKVAVATYKPKKSLSKPAKKPSYKDKISIKKPEKLPSWDEFYKGRLTEDKTTLPSLSSIDRLKNLDGNNTAVKLFNKSFEDEIENYNNWKWQYFNLKIEIEKEVNTIAQHVIKKLIIASNEASKVKDNTEDLEEEIKDIELCIEEYKSDLMTKNAELSDAGFLKRGSIKNEIKNIELNIKNYKADLSKTKRSLNSINKKLTSIKEIKSIGNGNEEFVSIYSKAFPDEKKPSKTFKSKIFFNGQFFLDTYRKVFDETWDKKIEAEINKLKEEENKKKEIQKTKEKAPSQPKSSKKDQLIELKELLDEGLISDEEFEESRKQILGLK